MSRKCHNKRIDALKVIKHFLIDIKFVLMEKAQKVDFLKRIFLKTILKDFFQFCM